MPVDLSTNPPRNIWTAVGRGAKHKCPNCGKGKLFNSYLKVASKCSNCGEELFHHRSDDAPPYFTIFVVGHIIIPLVLFVETAYRPELWVHAALWMPLTLILALLFLPVIKGMLVGYQWALYMHGFDRNDAPSSGAPNEA